MIDKIRQELNSFFIERQEAIDLSLVALLSKKNILFLGPPGTAKSLMARAVCSHIRDAKYFDYLLTKFTTPEELFGVWDINSIEQGKWIRITKNKLPESHIAFLDEIFKANSSILNTLLTILNERIFFNNDKPQEVPLISLFSASNELPEPEDRLEALFDRLHLRIVINPIVDNDNLIRLLKLNRKYEPKTLITIDQLQKLQDKVNDIDNSFVFNDLLKIVNELKQKGIYISDRRLQDANDVIKAYAFINERKEAINDDLSILQYVFWNDTQEIPTVKQIVLKISNPYEQKAEEFSAILDDLEKELSKYTELTQETIDILNKLKKINETLKDLVEQGKQQRRNVKKLEEVRNRTKKLISYIRKELIGEE